MKFCSTCKWHELARCSQPKVIEYAFDDETHDLVTGEPKTANCYDERGIASRPCGPDGRLHEPRT